MIKNLDELRKVAVKHILRKGKADYLLRHSLCKPWVASTHYDEMAWTDFKSLFFNFPKLRAQLDYASANQGELDPGDHTTAFLAAAAHEVLHVLWLHRYRAKDKQHHLWKLACEYSINYELASIFGKAWVQHLGVCYPPDELIRKMRSTGRQLTTDGFYDTLCEDTTGTPLPMVSCNFCSRSKPEKEIDPADIARTLNQLPVKSSERDDLIRFLVAEQTPSQKIPWEMLLLGGIEDAITQEQSWAMPSRRNELLPGWRHEKLLSFVWVLDVSPSIDDEMKQSFVNTVQAGINLYHNAQHRVIFFADDIVNDIIISSGANLSRMEIPSGDGTCLDDVWKVLERDLPEYALVLTDLELNDVPKPSFTKIIWGIVGDHRVFDPDYGVKIVLK